MSYGQIIAIWMWNPFFRSKYPYILIASLCIQPNDWSRIFALNNMPIRYSVKIDNIFVLFRWESNQETRSANGLSTFCIFRRWIQVDNSIRISISYSRHEPPGIERISACRVAQFTDTIITHPLTYRKG